MSKARELAELSRTVSDSADAVAITIDSSENVTFANDITVTGALTLGSTAITATGTELNYVDGVTSAIQTQIDAKAPLASPTFTGTVNAAALTVDTTTLVVDATNNRVGIGTSLPSTKLQVTGNSSSRNTIVSNATLDGGTTVSNPYEGFGFGINFIGRDYGNAVRNYASINTLMEGKSSSSGGGDAGFKTGLSFYTNGGGASGTNPEERMRIDSSGRVNIGGYANSQGYELEVVNDTNANTLLLHREEVSVGVVSTLGFQGTQANDQSARFAEISSEFDTFWGGDLVFSTKPANGTPNNTVSERMRIDSAGQIFFQKSSENIGVAGMQFLTNGLTQLTASGTPLYLNRLGSPGDIVSFRDDNATVGKIGTDGSDIYIGSDDTNLLFFQNGFLPVNSVGGTRDNASDLGAGSARFKDLYLANVMYSGSARIATTTANSGGKIQVKTFSGGIFQVFQNSSGSTIGYIGNVSNSQTLYAQTSDERLKENITDSADAGSRIDAIQVRQFDWKGDGIHQDYGMVAQELQTVAPEVVFEPEDTNDMMGVDYSKLVPMLVKEIQSLRARVQQLENN